MDLILGSVQTHGTMDLDLPVGPPLFRFGNPVECEQILSIAGFVSVSVSELPIVWTFSNPEDVMPGVIASTARLGPMLAMQTETQQYKIEQAIIEGAKQYATDGGIKIPAAVVIAIGRKPR